MKKRNGLIKRSMVLLENLGHVIYLMKTEWKSPMGLSFSQRVWLWRHGFLSKSGVRYGLNKANIRQYVSDYDGLARTAVINGEYGWALDNKVIFPQMLHEYTQFLPVYYGVIKDGEVLPLLDDLPIKTLENLMSLWERQKKLILKPVFGASGQGVYLLRLEKGQRWFNQTEISSTEEVKSWLSNLEHSLICEYVPQHPYAAEIFPEATNTLRIITMWDYAQNMPFIAAAIHRFGTIRSRPVDNTAQGGLYCSIDVTTGIIGKGVLYADAPDFLRWHATHPDTNAQLEGVRIPSWELVTVNLLEIARHLPFMPYIGWDILVTEQGFKIIEGNNSPSVELQVHRPLLADPRIRAFYEKFQVISRQD